MFYVHFSETMHFMHISNTKKDILEIRVQLNCLVHNKITYKMEEVYISTRLHKYFMKKNLYYLVKFLVSNLEFTENYIELGLYNKM